MATMEYQVQVNASPEEVFAYISDIERHPEWSHCLEIKKTSEGPIGVGTTYASKGKNMGIPANETVEVTEHQPNQRFGWQAAGAMGMKFGWSFEMKPQEGGTLLTERFEPPSGLVASVINTLAGSQTRKAMQEGLANIKDRLEGGRVEQAAESPAEASEGSEEQSS